MKLIYNPWRAKNTILSELTQPISPMRTRQSQNSTYRLLQIIIVLVAITARLVPGPRTIDDSYITYRYAQNILAGNGFVYNPGERVLGTTTPLYTILLSGLGYLTGGEQAPFPELALGLNTLFDAATCLLLLHLGRRLSSPLAGIAAAFVWAIAPFSVTFAIGGLETSLYLLLLTATISAYLDNRYILTASLGAMSLLTRPDALILLGPLAFDRTLELTGLGDRFGIPHRRVPEHTRSRPWMEIIVFAVPVLLWIVSSTAYFGSPLPHSIAAKSVAYRLPTEAAFVRLLQHYSVPFMGNQTFGSWWIAVGMLLSPFLFLVGARHAWREERHSWPFLAYPWLYFAVFAIANPLIFRWYLTPPLPAYMLTILIGAERLTRDVISRINARAYGQNPPQPGAITNIAGVLLVIGLPLLLVSQDWVLRPDHGLNRPAPGMAWYQLELLYRQAADSLAEDIDQQASPPTLAAGDVGVLGYFTGVRILDTVGLNSPQSTEYYPLDSSKYVINYAIPAELILDQRPDYIVILEVYGRESLLPDPAFQQAYRLRQKIASDIYGSDGMLIFERTK